jgi:hypothetical protein
MNTPIEKRHPVSLPATIHRGGDQSPVDCTVTEISERNPDFIPDTFMLTLAGGMNVRRRCTVMSREPGEVFVEIRR